MSFINFVNDKLGEDLQQLGKDGKDGKTYLLKTSKRFAKEKIKKNTEIAVKTFKSKKSIAKINAEADFQKRAALSSISVPIYAVDLNNKWIAMEKLDSMPAETYRDNVLPETLQYQLCALMGRLDSIGILHGDMNALNVMLSSEGRPYMIDFGFAKNITSRQLKKHGLHPNVRVSLWGLIHSFKRYKCDCSIMQECLDAYNAGEDISMWFERGEELFDGKNRKKRKRK